ncbi:hypothetical protein CCACVL1_07862 [Corchorus capsularis]|uniref:Uncharacterized protein n=1 Tax=Corchorus capsularis TaxID=210143 RepID=A0A1R3J3J0_COCAP|nr:hypothetical protein CCACVL1_07862 [Corchorus capsularis]
MAQQQKRNIPAMVETFSIVHSKQNGASIFS